MPDAVDWVVLVECHDVGELHALRALLEARGVPFRITGEHTHGIMGAFHGSMVRSRVLVPRPALAVARALATDIVGPFEDEPATEDVEPSDESPFRRPAEPVPEHDREAPAPRLKSYGRLLVVVFLVVGPFIGLAHIYAGRNLRAGLLALTTLVALPAALGGALWALLVLGGIWLTDLAGGAFGIAAHNRRVQQAGTAAAATPRALTAE